MVHRFDTFELDDAARELRANGAAVQVQPRVFDVLLYLVKNSERVVPKDELLDQLWPGVIVTDASLQRAISLGRAALAGLGAADAIRTHARQGYRFCLRNGAAATRRDEPPTLSTAAPDRARVAYARGEWEAALDAFHEVDDAGLLTADDVQCWTHAAQSVGRLDDPIVVLERTLGGYTASGDRRRAAWVAILLAQLRLQWREPVIAKGLYHRAMRLLESEPSCRETGYLDLLGAEMALLHNDLETTLVLGERARVAGETFGDSDLEAFGLALFGEASIFLGKITEGIAALDEAATAVVACNLRSSVGGRVYCKVIFNCVMRADWHRAAQWTDQFTRWSDGKGVAASPGLCRLHRAEVFLVRGDLPAAEREIRETQLMLAAQAPWAEGDAWRVLGDVLLAKGDFKQARAAYVRATELGWESHFGIALVRFLEGDPASAAQLLHRGLSENTWSCRSKRGQALLYYAITTAIAGDAMQARAALGELEREAELVSTPALQALLARARGEISVSEGHNTEGLVHLRGAMRALQECGAPLAAAQIQCRIAEVVTAVGDAEAAALELSAALHVFRRSGADGWLAMYSAGERAGVIGVGAIAPRRARSVRR